MVQTRNNVSGDMHGAAVLHCSASHLPLMLHHIIHTTTSRVRYEGPNADVETLSFCEGSEYLSTVSSEFPT